MENNFTKAELSAMNFKLKISAAVLLAILAASSLTSCSSKSVMTYGKHDISENEFIYYLATYKSRYAQTYTDFSDTHEFFAQAVGESGETAEDVLYSAVIHNVKMTLVSEALFDEYNLKLSSYVEETINEYIEDFIDEYSDGSKTKFNASLGEFGINAKMLKDIYLRDEKTSALYDALYGSGGLIGVTDSDREEYLNKNYVRVRHIYVNDKYTYSLDEDGVPEYNENGTQKTRSLTEEELAAKQLLINAIDESLSEGGDFEAIYEAFSEDQYYKNGYYISENMDFIDDVTTSAFDLEIGEYTKIESDYGTHYIMRLEMDDKPWEDEANADFFADYDTTVSEVLFAEMIEGYIDEVWTDDEILSEYTIEASPINYRF